ncbi:hypothetical protein DLAC_03144 [Tieghemostelium lacteum]|uniref:Uncharacterized protein n=1 Tax=Tieghemostelium lacteum TaxID=361077 RepID=A0A152A2R4_TIELA|nr:hypothetical protein DLAC_03144 [Tieghemostelium lacteum]|eukprot:KYR00395.1 hypothetical protein DLAC_03144 [Tieghemostelium lacteum]
MQQVLKRKELKNSEELDRYLNEELLEWLSSPEQYLNKVSFVNEILKNYKRDPLFCSNIVKILVEFDISKDDNSNRVKSTTIEILLTLKELSWEYYVNGIYRKFLQSTPKLQKAIFNNYNPELQRSIQRSYVPELFPFESLVKVIKTCNESKGNLRWEKHNIDRITSLAFAIVKKTYFPKLDGIYIKSTIENDFANKNYVILEGGLSRDFVRGVIEFILSDTLEGNLKNDVEDMIFFLCIMTFQNLKEDDIYDLKEDYLKLIPYIFKYRLSRSNLRVRFHKKALIKPQKGQSNMYFLKKYYGEETIESESISWFLKWTKDNQELSESKIYCLIGLVNSLSDICTEKHLTEIYKILVQGFTTEFPYDIYLQISDTLDRLINRFGKLSPQNFQKLYNHLTKNLSILDENFLIARQNFYNLYTALLSNNPSYTIKNLDEIVKWFKNIPKNTPLVNHMIHLNKVLCSPLVFDSLLKSKNFDMIHKEIECLAKRSSEDNVFLLEYLMSVSKSGNAENKKNFKLMYKSISKGINSNKKWVHKNDHFYEQLLIYYGDLKEQQGESKGKSDAFVIYERTIRAFVKTIEDGNKVSLDLISSSTNDIKEVDYLFKQVNELLSTPESTISLLIHFIDIESGDKYVVDYLNSFINQKFQKSSGTSYSHIDQTSFSVFLLIIDGLKRYVNIESQIETSILFNIKQKSRFDNVNNKRIISLLKSLNDFNGFFCKFIDCAIENGDISDPFGNFEQIYKGIFGPENKSKPDKSDSELLHRHLVNSILKKYKLNTLSVEILKKVLLYHKMISQVEDREMFIDQFKSFSVAIKKIVLKFIRSMKIESLEFLNDSTMTAFHFDHEIVVPEFNNCTPNVQNLIVQRVLKYICNNIGTKRYEILDLALTSKVFFVEIQKIFKNNPMDFLFAKLSILSIYPINVESQWSLLSQGLYELSYSKLQMIKLNSQHSVIQGLSSLIIRGPADLYYHFTQPLPLLTRLRITAPKDTVSISALVNLLNHCPRLETFEITIITIEHFIEPFHNILDVLFKLNSMVMIKVFYTLNPNYDKSLQFFQVLKRIRKHHKNTNQKVAYKFTLQFPLPFAMDNVSIAMEKPNPEDPNCKMTKMYKTYSNNCHTFIVNGTHKTRNTSLINGTNFKRLRKLCLETKNSVSEFLEIKQSAEWFFFFSSPNIKIQSLHLEMTLSSEEMCHNINEIIVALHSLEHLSIHYLSRTESQLVACVNIIFLSVNQNQSIQSFVVTQQPVNVMLSKKPIENFQLIENCNSGNFVSTSLGRYIRNNKN